MISYEKLQDMITYSLFGSTCAFILAIPMNDLYISKVSKKTHPSTIFYYKDKYTNLFISTMMVSGAVIGGLFVHNGKRPLLLRS